MNMTDTKWIICPRCGEKTRVKIQEATLLKNFPLFCTWCKKETLIDVEKFKVKVIEK